MSRIVAAQAASVGSPAAHALTGRRLVFAVLVLATIVAAIWGLARILGQDGVSVVDGLILAAFIVTLPWTVIGFWNALIGLAILRLHPDPLRYVAPLEGLEAPALPLPPRGRTAIVWPTYNEDPAMVVRHLLATVEDLARTGDLDAFDVFWLSDSQRPELFAEEAEAAERIARHPDLAGRFHYRRRTQNTAYKTGNIWDFIETHGARFDHMLVLDADSLMAGSAIRRLVRVMEANPRLGILQTLITGLPTQSAFTRLFQFGMRHGMRSYTTGSTWWQGPAGPYWGHNGLINLPAFRAHCRLPELGGRAPWGGLVLSHDLLEAVLMRRAGYEVRVLPDEFGSFELNPPCLPEFVRRSLRWCQGNLQYVRLVGRPGWHAMGRLQLALAILMYLSGPAWMLMMAFGFVQGAFGVTGGMLLAEGWGPVTPVFGLGLMVAIMTMAFMPKLAGLGDALLDRAKRRSYGGGLPLVGAGVAEMLYSMFLAPIMALSETFFVARMLGGRGLAWSAQQRGDHGVGWREATRRFWPPTLAGIVILSAFWAYLPAFVLWALPLALGPLLVIPFTWLSTRQAVGRTLARWRFAGIPEEYAPQLVVRAALPWLGERRRWLRRRRDPMLVGRPIVVD